MPQDAVDGAALALEDLDDGAGELVDVGRGQPLEERLEAVEELGEVERGRGAESGMVSPGRNVRPTGPAPWSRSTYRWPTMLRYLMEAVTEAGRSRPLRTAKATSASRRSATRTDCT